MRRSKASKRSGAISDSRNGYSEVESEAKREKAMAILENQQSGNPFENRELPEENMYYHDGADSKPNSKSLSSSMNAKKKMVKSSFPDIKNNESSNSNFKRHYNSSKKLSMRSSHNGSEDGRSSKNSTVRSKSKQMASFDAVAAKSVDRLSRKIEHPKHTIMTANNNYNRQTFEIADGKQLVGFATLNLFRLNGTILIEAK